jgi:hypothetical protein
LKDAASVAPLPAPTGRVSKRRRMMILAALPLFICCCKVLGQVTIRNSQHVPVSEQDVQVLFNLTCQVVAREFHVSSKDVDFPIVLVLGDTNERFSSDEERHLYSVYLYRWNEAQFADASMKLAIQHMVTQTRRERMVNEILKRYSTINTIPIKALQHQ